MYFYVVVNALELLLNIKTAYFIKKCRCGTSGYGLVRMVVLGGWLDWTILEVFSNLWFYDSTIQQACWGVQSRL